MRYAILADIHSNLAAFEAVLENAKNGGGFQDIWCLGDIVGYGPDPRECIQLLRQHRHFCIAGNHDWAAVGKLDISHFNPEAAAAAHWTAKQLTSEDAEYLRSLPQTLQRDDFTLAHGSFRKPIWEHVDSIEIARANFACFDTRFCLVGHSHVPLIFELDRDSHCRLWQPPRKLLLQEEKYRLIINCGGVGQPRDGDLRASYAILDTEEAAIYRYRVYYDVSITQLRMREAGLPVGLIKRLKLGW